MTLPTFTPRPPEIESEPVVETSKTGKVTDRRTVERMVAFEWPCRTCGETAVVDVEGRCRACWRWIVLFPAVLASVSPNHETTGGTS